MARGTHYPATNLLDCSHQSLLPDRKEKSRICALCKTCFSTRPLIFVLWNQRGSEQVSFNYKQTTSNCRVWFAGKSHTCLHELHRVRGVLSVNLLSLAFHCLFMDLSIDQSMELQFILLHAWCLSILPPINSYLSRGLVQRPRERPCMVQRACLALLQTSGRRAVLFFRLGGPKFFSWLCSAHQPLPSREPPRCGC